METHEICSIYRLGGWGIILITVVNKKRKGV